MTRPTAKPAEAVRNWRGSSSEPGRKPITKASVDAQVAHQRQLYAKNHPPKKTSSQHNFSGLKWFR
jgi:hypothetical protein